MPTPNPPGSSRTPDGDSAPPGSRAFTSTVTRTLSAVQERCTESFTGRTEANDAVTAAERTREDARDAVTKARQRADGIRSALVRAHAAVAADGAPAVDTTTLEDAVAGWGALTAWCSEQVARIETDLLPEARDAATAAGTRLREATEALASGRGDRADCGPSGNRGGVGGGGSLQLGWST